MNQLSIRISLSFLILLTSNIIIHAQAPSIAWQKTFGGPGNDIMQDIYPTTDGNFIMLGLADSTGGDVTCSIKGKHDTWVIKMAPDSTILWQKCFGGSKEEGNPNSKIIQTSDGGYLFQTETWSSDFDISGHHGESDAWTMKLDADGNIVWARSYGGSNFDVPRNMLELPGGKYLMLSRTTSQNGDVPANEDPDLFDAWVFIADSEGNIIQNNIYGGTGDDELYTAILRPDNTIAMFGETTSSDGDLEGLDVQGLDAWMLVIDTSGNVISSRVYGQENEETFLDAHATDDGGYIAFGDTQDPTIPVDKGSWHGDYDFWAVKLDAEANIQWQGIYGGLKREQFRRGAISPSDGGYFMGGSTLSTDGDIINEEGKAREYWFIHIADDGEFLWGTALGGDLTEYIYSIVPAGIVVGGAFSDDGDVIGMQGAADGWVIKFDVATVVQEMAKENGLVVYPNPATDKINVNLYGIEIPSVMEVKNVYGQTVYSSKSVNKMAEINVSSWPTGVYYLFISNTADHHQYVKAFEVVN